MRPATEGACAGSLRPCWCSGGLRDEGRGRGGGREGEGTLACPPGGLLNIAGVQVGRDRGEGGSPAACFMAVSQPFDTSSPTWVCIVSAFHHLCPHLSQAPLVSPPGLPRQLYHGPIRRHVPQPHGAPPYLCHVHTPRRHPYPRLVSHANYIMDQYVDMYRSRMAGGARAILKRFKALNTHDWRELVSGVGLLGGGDAHPPHTDCIHHPPAPPRPRPPWTTTTCGPCWGRPPSMHRWAVSGPLTLRQLAR